jgi:hypothetical protein
MRKLTGVFMGLATPALAHDGAHFNPHGGEIVLVALVAMAGGLVLAWRRR